MSEEQKVSVEEAIETVLGEEQETVTETESTVEAELVEPEEVEEPTEQEANMIEELGKKLALTEEKLAATEKELAAQEALKQAAIKNEIRKAGIDAESKVKRTLKRFTEELLPVADSLEMAVSHIDKDNEALAKMAEGVELTLKSMIDSFAKVGIMQINPVGEQANPDKHQIVSQQKIEGKAANEVVVVMQKGYEYNGQIIRPAMVMVASA
ncbi:nucleotide exchange factor GrpE [Psychromonas sp. psych-6C06]|uniref:nucleotide exchange factor GrpE n=1 Tax=Psychromonas sp. psych-6C06 TaxID=2058089 RepID=UPI000C3344D6|nr:nucleotide exchange factor GrpE [Psychromonas sp. psych-6C06]PKF62694.1 nucleotide exchange factor GrpE [Psychromonas sp. psych-6C06]